MERELDENARYWQRKDTTDAIYQQGPKAQQMLFQDMARCTAGYQRASERMQQSAKPFHLKHLTNTATSLIRTPCWPHG